MTWIYHRTEEVEAGRHLKGFASGSDEFHSVGEEGSMEVTDVCLVKTAFQLVGIVCEFHSVTKQNIAGSADRGAAAISVFGDFISCSGNDKCRTGRYVEGIFAIATCTNYVEGVVFFQVDVFARFEQSLTESEQLIDCDSTSLNSHKQSCYLLN